MSNSPGLAHGAAERAGIERGRSAPQVEVVQRPGGEWDAMTAAFADASYEQSVAYAASRWGARRLVGIVLRDALVVTLKAIDADPGPSRGPCPG